MTNRNNHWIPEICYEESEEGITSNIPFINVPPEEEMPKVVFIFESKDTGEVEPGTDGSDLPVYEMNLHQYADMAILKEGLSPLEYDNVRKVLGLEPLMTAIQKGKKITDSVRKSVT
tara:strand:+ start:1528 stop:1878 length:351 start_codon:yes stop_codon:yes gene_type:complete